MTAWIATHDDGRVLHFATQEGWKIERVVGGEPDKARAWPFANSPSEVANKLRGSYHYFGNDMLAAVREIFIERGEPLAAQDQPQAAKTETAALVDLACAREGRVLPPTPTAEPNKARELWPKVVAALQWALDQIGPPDGSRTEKYHSDYHAANYALFLANGRGFGIAPPEGESK